MNYKNTDKKQAQILVITLLILMIVAIAIIGAVNLINRDVSQITQNQKFQEVYNAAETRLQIIVERFGDAGRNQPLSQITRNDDFLNYFDACSETTSNSSVEVSFKCKSEGTDLLTSSIDIVTELTISDKKEISDIEVLKDNNFVIDLGNYKEGLDLYWDENIAVEVTLVAKDASNQYKTIVDVIDRYGVYTSGNAGIFIIGPTPDGDPNKSVRIFSLGTTPGIDPTDRLESLIITPRGNASITKFSMKPRNYSSFPYQVREFQAFAYDAFDESSPLSSLTALISLVPQTDSIFNYSLLTKDSVEFN